VASVQRARGTKLLWVKTTPVPTVPAYGHGCNGTATVCLNPARYDADVVLYNAAADAVVAAANAGGARIATADLYTVRAARGRLSGISVCNRKSILYGALVWACRALVCPKRRFPARAVCDREMRARLPALHQPLLAIENRRNRSWDQNNIDYYKAL
jgi:hypothetical protein